MSSVTGATLLDADEAADLIPSHIETLEELNAWEQENIASALHWATRRRSTAHTLSVEFIRELHRRMFRDTWKWAGRFRRTAKNVGVPAARIGEQLKDLLDDTSGWIEHNTYATDEIAARFHHRLISIHPFPNGNGRHARMMTDTLLVSLGAAPFTWGFGTGDAANDVRASYLRALRDADGRDYTRLMRFVRC